jgi:eukaryotic-like serine/threonine-protein kinase
LTTIAKLQKLMKLLFKKSILFSCAFLVSGSLFKIQACAQITMFRNVPDHNYSVKSKTALPFSEAVWKFNASGPVRSTVATSNNAVFFGGSAGIYYSLNKFTGKVNWSFNAGSAINSSAALNNSNIFFSDNKQVLYSLDATTGKVNWKTGLGRSKIYEWAFDYYYSSPTIAHGRLFIGSKDGYVYCINESTGQINWKFKTGGIVRSSPAVAGNTVYAGDTDGSLFAIDSHNGKEIWHFFTTGHSLKNEDFGFDRRAIIASPVIAGNNVVVGSRDGFLYSVNKNTGKEIWRVNHNVSWVISSVAIKDNIVVTGTSDGRFVQAVNLYNGKQIWKYNTPSIIWSSPVIDGNRVYIGSHEGLLYCLDLKTGIKISSFQADGIIFSSPVISGEFLYFGCDDGYVYALKPGGFYHLAPLVAKRYVFWEPGNHYYKYGTDIRIKQYLTENGYIVLDKEKLIAVLQKTDSAMNSVIVFATNFFEPEITNGANHSLLRNYLNKGGKVVVTGINPVLYQLDPKEKSLSLRSYTYADSVLSVKYGPDDLRSYKGNYPAFSTKDGNEWGLASFWAAPLSLPVNQVDIVLGMDENGLASAWVKKFNPAKGSGFVQVWIMENTINFSSLTRVAEYGLK